MRQKFRKLTFVHVYKDMPPSMSHFENDFDAIIEGTYSQIFGGTDIDSYALFQVKDDRIINRRCWYHESQLTELEFQDRDKAEEMIEDYNFKNQLTP